AGNKKEKRHLLLCMGHVENVPITFAEFIEFICRQNPREMDPHYAPQVSLMQLDHVRYAKIGCVEDMENSLATIMAAGYGIAPRPSGNFRPHGTGASSRLAQYYTADLAAKVLERFRADFDRFGYSTDPSESHLPPRDVQSAAQSGSLSESVLRPGLRATLSERDKNYDAALNILSTIASPDPELDAMKARILLRLNRPGEALGLLEGVLKRVPNVSQYWISLAECLQMLRRTEEAV